MNSAQWRREMRQSMILEYSMVLLSLVYWRGKTFCKRFYIVLYGACKISGLCMGDTILVGGRWDDVVFSICHWWCIFLILRLLVCAKAIAVSFTLTEPSQYTKKFYSWWSISSFIVQLSAAYSFILFWVLYSSGLWFFLNAARQTEAFTLNFHIPSFY